MIKCLNTPGNFECVCRSNYDDISNTTSLPPGRICRLNPDLPEELDYDLHNTELDSTLPESSLALKVLPGRPIREHLYGPNVWLKKYRYCAPGKLQLPKKTDKNF